jgi:N-acetylmuramic acid 6-phosphate etherase
MPENQLTEEVLGSYTTEQRNEASINIDRGTSLDIVTVINNEDKKVPLAVERALPAIAAFVDEIVKAFEKGGRLVYTGAGTSGRLGVLDASECPPTYGVEPGMVQGIIAGGRDALTNSIEGVEDKAEAGAADLQNIGFTGNDVLLGITASGQAPYVLGALEYAKKLGAVTGALSCNENSKTFDIAAHRILVKVGPEVVTGSTRMKSGTAQKLVLNMLSTAAMIRLGKVYKNLMVDVKPANHKLVLRSLRIIREAAGCSGEEAEKAFEASGRKPKIAIVMLLMGADKTAAEELLKKAEGHINRLPGLGAEK